MPHELYLIRLIHRTHRLSWRTAVDRRPVGQHDHDSVSARSQPGRLRYRQPYGGKQNAGYILVDLDVARPSVIADMCANGHDPCVVLQTSPRHLQAWIRISLLPLEPAVATAAGK